ncbi:energy-coupling factor transporter transmembrane component T family protein [Mycoplasma todarodis]|uniref:Energy-coupling factor transporter transmembrane protein EcfT n=1 Tax=Mycoplasma todarodis TaxID=1937191 RepID=A0A4R0XUV8_9MOLU|nr:energy-coupling factor transporter transmembrane protein EcfT [Mycoplasma todarodis]TCG10681.1 energy-coupling factor transporter transmembrane protein EcfT [Mycoplasma todarodis]
MQLTVGKYIPNDTFVHRLDPRVKLLCNILLIVIVFLNRSYIGYGIIMIPVITCYAFSKMPIRKLLSMLKPVIFIGVFLFIINIFIVKPTSDQWFHTVTWWKIKISGEAVDRTALIAVRVYFMIIITTILTATTKPIDLTRGLEDLMMPLKIIKFPVHIIAMIIAIALRFIPTLLEESQRIMKAQASRGVDFKNGGPKAKVKSTVTLIIPLFVTSFSKAEDLGNAMETRGYDPYAKRTRYRKYSIKYFDVITLSIVIGMLVWVILGMCGISAFPMPY